MLEINLPWNLKLLLTMKIKGEFMKIDATLRFIYEKFWMFLHFLVHQIHGCVQKAINMCKRALNYINNAAQFDIMRPQSNFEWAICITATNWGDFEIKLAQFLSEKIRENSFLTSNGQFRFKSSLAVSCHRLTNDSQSVISIWHESVK